MKEEQAIRTVTALPHSRSREEIDAANDHTDGALPEETVRIFNKYQNIAAFHAGIAWQKTQQPQPEEVTLSAKSCEAIAEAILDSKGEHDEQRPTNG